MTFNLLVFAYSLPIQKLGSVDGDGYGNCVTALRKRPRRILRNKCVGLSRFGVIHYAVFYISLLWLILGE